MLELNKDKTIIKTYDYPRLHIPVKHDNPPTKFLDDSIVNSVNEEFMEDYSIEIITNISSAHRIKNIKKVKR